MGGVRANPRRVNEIRQTTLNLTDPQVRHSVRLVSCRNRRGEDDELIVLDVEPSERMHRLTDGSAWLRVGDETRELDIEQALHLSYDKGISQFDSELAQDATLDDLDGTMVERYRDLLASSLSPTDVLVARGLCREHGTGSGVTWAGLLLFGHDPLQFYPNA